MTNALGGTPTIIYFPSPHRGLGEILRLFLVDAGIDFKDEPFQRENWLAVKQKIIESGENPLGSVPLVKLGNRAYHATTPTIKYWSKKLGKYLPKDVEEEYFVDQAVDAIADWRGNSRVMFGSDEQAKETYKRDILPRLLKAFDVFLGKYNGPYLLGSDITYADFTVYQCLSDTDVWGRGAAKDLLNQYPNVKAFVDALENRPKLKEFLADKQ